MASKTPSSSPTNQSAKTNSESDKCPICLYFKAKWRACGSKSPICPNCSSFFTRIFLSGSSPTKARNCQGNCPFIRHNHANCAFCRFQKCLGAGLRRVTAKTDAAPPLPPQESSMDETEREEIDPKNEEERNEGSWRALPPQSPLSTELAAAHNYTDQNYVQPEAGYLFNFKLIVSEPRPSSIHQLMKEASSRIFILNVHWAKCQPLFQKLSFNIQVPAFKSIWESLFILGLLELKDAEGEIREEIQKIIKLKEILNDIHNLKLDRFEYAALKTTILSRSCATVEWLESPPPPTPTFDLTSIPEARSNHNGSLESIMKTVEDTIQNEWESYLLLKKQPISKSRTDKAAELRDKIFKMTTTHFFETFCTKNLMSFKKIRFSIDSIIKETECFDRLFQKMNGPKFWIKESLETVLLKIETKPKLYSILLNKSSNEMMF